jgi:hypothetical protein
MSHDVDRRRPRTPERRDVGATADLHLSGHPDVVAWTIDADAEGRPLAGVHDYVLHFDRGQSPPAFGFWSLVMHEERSRSTERSADRRSIGDRTALTFERDGSLNVFVSSIPPCEARRSNWLPAPRGPFHLVLNIYWPRPDVLSGAWVPPAIAAADSRLPAGR